MHISFLGKTSMQRIAAAFGVQGLLYGGVLGLALASSTAFASEPCGTGTYPFPYTDVSGVGDAFCPGIMEAYVTGVSKGTTPTTFSPNETVTRVQMTTFLQRSLDQGLTRASRRAALNQWWVPQNTNAMQTVVLSGNPVYCASDGENIWVTTIGGDLVKVQANTGTVLGSWTGAFGALNVLVAAGRVFVTGGNAPGDLYVIDPTQAPGAVTTASSALGDEPLGIAFDGTNIWTANIGPPTSVSIIDPQTYAATTVGTGFASLRGVLYDGAHIWVTDRNAGTLLKLSPAGAILQTVTVGTHPLLPVFDGANIWVPNGGDNSISVVQASSGNVVATIAADASNNLSQPTMATFDGERILVTNFIGDSVSVFKAADLSFIANVSTGGSTSPEGACSDGINFWVSLDGAASLLRF
jgi:DNA-binding beta-propeller fold protein YncE